MIYEKQIWTDDVSVLSAERLNHIEEGIYDASKYQVIPNITVESGVTHGDFIYPVIENDAEIWKIDDSLEQDNGKFICGAVNENTADAIRAGLMPMPGALITALGQDDTDGRYSLYVQADGKLGLGVTNIHAGFIFSDTAMFVDFNPVNKNPKAYTTDMTNFYAMTGPSGSIRLKIELPSTADGAYIYRNTTAYAGEGRGNWGILVENVTDDTIYKRNYEWLEDDDGGSLLTNGTTYYYKAFPYVGSVVNDSEGNNEISCRAGYLEHEWVPKDISGAIIPDRVGSINVTCSNMSLTSGGGKIEDALTGSNGYGSLSSTFEMANKSIFAWVNVNSTYSGLFGNSATHDYRTGYMSSANYLTSASRADSLTHLISTGWKLCGIFFGQSGTSNIPIKMWIDNTNVRDTTRSWIYMYTTMNRIYYAKRYSQTNTFFNTDVDVFRVFTNYPTQNELDMLYNGGAGC